MDPSEPLTTRHVSRAPELIPVTPYFTMKARADSALGPWLKQRDVVPFRCQPETYYSDTASPGRPTISSATAGAFTLAPGRCWSGDRKAAEVGLTYGFELAASENGFGFAGWLIGACRRPHRAIRHHADGAGRRDPARLS